MMRKSIFVLWLPVGSMLNSCLAPMPCCTQPDMGDGPALEASWTETARSAGCPTGAPVRELVFSPGNRFSVTFQPFETYRDYWGSYEFDAASGRLSMTATGGNHLPEGLDLDGTVSLPDGETLVMDGFWLGTTRSEAAGAPSLPEPSCRYSFE